MRISSFRKIRRLFSFASMGIARASGRGVRRRNAFKQRRDAFNTYRLGNEPLEPRLLLATNITAGSRAPDLLNTSDSGFSQTDNYTFDTTPTFEFNAGGLNFGNTPATSGPETLELLINGTSRAFTMTGGPNSLNGAEANRELTLNNPLADGTYTASFRITDSQATPGTSTSPGLTFTIDTTINPVNARLISGGNQSSGVHLPGDDIVITLTFNEEVEFGGGNSQSPGDPDTEISLEVGTPLSATDPVGTQVTGGESSGGLVTDQEYRFNVTANPGTSTDADGVFIDFVSGIFYDRAGNSVTDPTLGSYRGFKTGTLTFTNPVTSSTLFGVLDNSQISYPVSSVLLRLNAPVPGPPLTPVGVAVGIEDFQLTRDGEVININAASITSPVIGPNAFSEFLLGDLEQFTNQPGRYRLVFADASIGPTTTLEWVKSVPTAGELIATLTPFPTDATPTTPRNIPVEGIALEFLDNAGNPTPVTGVDTTAVGGGGGGTPAITQFEIYKDGVLVPWSTPALSAVNISGSGSSYTINGLANYTNSDGYYQVFLSDSSAIETLDGTQLITTYSTSWEFTSKVIINSVTPPANSTYKNNEVLSFDVNFSDFVNIDPASPPTLTIDIGGQLRTATYAAGDGTQTLTFNYTVGSVGGSDDIDLDGIELRSPLSGTVTDLWGTDVDPRLTPPSMADVLVLSTTPTIPPTIDSIESGSTQPRITGTAQLSDGDTLSVVVAGISNSYHGSTYTVVPVNNTWTLDMSAVNPDNVSTTGDIPANGVPNDDVITNISTAGLVAGMVVSHPDIPPGTTILTKSATTITLSASATGGASTDTLTFSATPAEATLTNPANYSVTAIITDAAGNTIDETDVFNTGTTAPTIETLVTSSDEPTIRGSAVLQAGESLSITVHGATYGNVTTSNVTTDGDIANGSFEIDNIDTSGLVVGLVVNHPDFPIGTIITAIDPTGGSGGTNGKITVDNASTVVGPTTTSITFENIWSLDLGTVLPSTGTLGAFVDGEAVDVVATVFGSIGYSITDTTTGELTVDRTLTPVAPGLAILPDAADGATITEAAAGVVTVSGVLGNTITVTFTGQAGVVEKTVTATGGLAQVVTLTGSELSTLGEGGVQVSAVQTDPAGNVSPSTSATSTPVTGPTTAFDVGIEVGAGLPSTFNAIAEAATNIWSQVIVGDLSDQVHPTTGEVIDELYIEFQAGLLGNSPSDGTNGTLANAGPRNFRGPGDANPYLPYRGEVGIDMADINNPDLLDIVVHEIGHVLGFPASTPFQNLITPAGFTGSNAVAEFVALGIDPSATAVPLDANDAHWDESVLGNEVMSQFAGPQYYLSRVTIGAFEDIGYEVNYAGADTYALFIANAESAFSIDTTAPDDATITLTPGVSDPIGTATATDPAGFISVEGEAGAEIIVTFTDSATPTPNVVTKTLTGSGAAQQVSLSAADLLLLDDGSIDVEVSQTDAAGNPQTGTPGTSVSITLDTDAPLAPVLALGVGVSDGATTGEATQVGGVVTVNGEASSSIEVTFTGSNGSVIKTIAGTGSADAVILNTNDLANIGGGTVTVSAIQTDEAGNTQTEPASTIVFELTIPIAPTVDALTTATVLPTISGTTGTGSALNAGEVLTVTINGATYEVAPDVSGNWSLDLSTAAPISGSLNTFTDGNYSVTATVTDATGNAATDSTANEIRIDTTAPAAPTVDAFVTNNDSPTITGTATLADDESLTVTVNGITYNTTGDVTIVGNTWSLDLSALSAPVTLADGTYSVTATATDTAGNTVNDGTTEELVIDTVAPTVSTVTTSTPDGTYGIGAVIDIAIQLSESVTVNTALGSPTLTLNTTPTRNANFTSAVGNILTFTYTSQEGDLTSGLDVDGLNLNGAVIEDAAGNPADDSNLGSTVNLDALIEINAVIPSATVTVTGLGDDYTYDVDQVIELTANFGTAVNVVGTPTIGLLIGTNVVDASYATGSGTSEIKFRYQIQPGDLDEDGIEIPTAAIELAANTTITDVELGNDVQLTFTPPNTQQVNVNSLPRVEGIAASIDGASITDGSYDTGDVITLTLNTTRPVKVSDPQNTKLYLNTDGSNATDYAIFVGDSSTFTDQLEFQYTVADGDNSEDLDYLNTTSLDFGPGTIKSAAGINLSPDLQVPGTLNSLSYGNEIIINTRAPQVESFSTINPDGRYSVGQNIVIRATLSEEVAANQTFKLVLDTGVGRTVDMTTDGSTRASGIYTIQPGDSSDALKILDILPELLADAAGNSLLTTLPSSITVGNIIVDTQAPTITNFNVTEINGSPASASESGLFGVGSTLRIEATTSEEVRAGSTIEATLNNGDVVRLSAATAGTTLSGTYTVGSDSSSTTPDLSVDSFTPIVMRDVAGNPIVDTTLPAFPNNIGDVHDLEIDTTPPNVVEFTADDGTYKAGDNIAITATLSEEINGTHDLKIELSSGGFANLAIADGANIAVGNYTVQPGDTTSDLTVAKIYAGSIVDFANNQLFTVLPSGTNLGDTADIVLDTTAPTVEALVSDLTTINSTQSATINITLSEDSTDFSIFDLNTTSGRFDPLSFSGSGSNYTVGFIPDADFEGDAVISVDNGSFNDTVGNTFNSTTPTLTIAVDSKAPTIGISADNTSLLAGDTSTLTLTLSEEAANATDFGFADLAVSNGTLDINTFTPVTATEYTVVYTPEQDFEGTVTFNVAGSTFSDMFLNPNEASTDFNITVDTKVPTATLTSDLASLNATQNATINITLSEASSVTQTGDVPSAGDPNNDVITNVDTTVLAVGMTVSGGDVPVGATIASIDSTTQLTLSDPVASGTGTTAESLTFEFNEFEFSDLTATNGILDPTSFTAISSTEYSVVFIPNPTTTDDAIISIEAGKFKDLSGNNNAVESNLTIAVDTDAPTVVDVTPVLSTLNASQNTVVNINLSEDSADFTVDDLTVTNGTFENGSFTGSGSNYSVVFVPDADIEDTALVTVANGSLTDLAGNPLNSTAPIATLTLDTKLPTVDITPDDSTLSIGENTTLTLTLSDAPGNVSDFTFENLSVSNGTLDNTTFVNVDPTTYKVDYTPDADFEGNVTVLAAAGQFTDAALNPNAEGNLTLAVDTKAPTATITSDINPVNGVQNATISITLSEDSNDFEFADLSATKGTLDPVSFTGSGSNYSVVFIPDSATTDDAVISIAAGTFADGSGNNNAVESNLTIAVDTVAPTVLDVTPVSTNLNASQNTTVSINLSEDSTDFTVDDLTVTNGTFEPGSFTGSGSNYSVVFVPDADVEDTAVVSVANGSFTDLAGNPLDSTAPNATLTLDTKAPAAPALTLEGGLPVTDPVSLEEATQNPNGVVSVQGEVGATINVNFTGTGGTVQKTITGDGTTQGVVLNSTEAASLGQGPVSVEATQTDAFLNPQTDPASTLSFELDTIAPNAATVAFAAGVTDAVSDAESSIPVTVNGEVDAELTVTFAGDDGSVTQNLTGTGIDQNVNLNAAQLLQIDSDGVGPVEVSVTQSDLAGNNQTAGAETLTFTLDRVAPNAPGLTLAGSDPLSADEAATPVTIAAEADASVTVVFEGVSGNVTRNITGTGSSQNVTLNTSQLATLGDGLVSVSASQVDQAGNPQSGAANTTAFTLDTVAPAAPQLALGNGIVGTVSSDEATRAAGVVTVQGEVASTITVTFLGTSGVAVTKSVTGDGSAQGVVLLPADLTTLGDGAVSVSATQADEAGNQQTLPATTMSFNLDATAPAAAGLSLNIPTGDLPVGIDEVTQPTGIVVVSGELDAEITITFAGQANTIEKSVSGTNTPQPITLTLAEANFLGQGSVTVTVSQTDDAGNLQDAAAASVAFDLDTIAPVAPVVSLESSILPPVSQLEATQDPAGVITVVGEVGATVVVTLTGSADQISKTITSSGTDGVVLTNADLIILGEGTVNVSAIQTDPSGNVSPVGTTSFLLDSIAPIAPAIALTSTLDNPVSEAEALSSSGVVTVTGEVNAAIAVTFTGQSGTLTRNLTGVGAPQPVILSSGDLATLGDGSVSVTAVQTDEAGNVSPTGSLPSFVLDTVAPAAPVIALNVSVTDPITAIEATQATGIATVTGEDGSTISVTLVGSNNLPVVKQIAGNGSTLMPVVLNGSDLIILGEGIVNVTAIQTDEAGNQQTVGGASLSFVLDTVKPVVSQFGATTPSGNYKDGETINLVATLSEVTQSGTSFTAVLNTGATVVFTASSTGTVLEGSYTIGGTHNANPLAVDSILPGTVLDEAGNSLATTIPSSNTFDGIVVDTTSPQPAAIALLSSDPVSGSEATAPGGVASVTAEPGATVDVTITGTNGTLNQSLLGTGSAQPIKLTAGNLPTLGDGLVTLTAVQTDAAGNRQILPDQTIAFTLDTVIPATPTMDLGTGVSDGATAAEATQAAGVVRVTGEAGASISVTLTGTAGTVTPSPIIANGVSQAVRLTSGDLNTLGEGLVIVSAVQTDAAGNTQPIAAELTFRLDTVAPAEPVVNLANGVTNPISLAEATQVAAAGGLISVRGEAGAELTVVFSGALGGVTRTFTATGFNQPIELSPAEVTSLGDGLLDVTARQVDPAGNNSSETTPMNLTLDTVDPTIYSRLLDAPAGFYNAGDQIPIVITLSEPAVPGQQLSVLLNVLDPSDNPVRVLATVGTGADAVKAFGTYTVASGQNTADLAIDSVLNDQANNFVTDVAGNKLIDDNAQQSSSISSLVSGSSSSSSVSSGIVIDTSAPEIVGISSPSTQTVYKEGDTVTIVVGLNEPVKAGSKIEVKLNSRPDTQPSLVLEALADGTTMIGHYTVGLAEVADQLAISSTSANIQDLAGNQFVHSESNSLVSSLLSGIEIDGSITVAENGANWGPQPEEGYQSVTIDLTADVTGVTLDAFTLTHNGRTISLRDASLEQTTSANYVLRLPDRVANLSGGFTITIWSTDIRTLTTNAEDMDSPIVIVMPDPGDNTDLTNGRTTGD